MGQVSTARERLLETTLELVHAKSYASVGVQELCNRAGVQKGSFYHFFESKRQLVLAAIDYQWQLIRSKVFEVAFERTNPPLKRIEKCFQLFYESQCAVKKETGRVTGCPFGNLALELSTQETLIRQRIERVFKDMARYIESALTDAVRAGDIPPQDVVRTTTAILALKQGAMLLAKAQNNPKIILDLQSGFLLYLMSDHSTGIGKKDGIQKGE